MLAPLIRWRPAGALSNDFPDTLCVGRGQILGIQGHGWRELFALLQDSAAQGNILNANADIQDVASLTGCCDRMARPDSPPLWLISMAACATPVQLRPLQGLLEKLGRRGGGALLGADALPAGMPFTQIISPPMTGLPAGETGELLDDQGMPVNSLRQGEWGALRFSLGGTFPLGPLDTVRLRISGSGSSWNSEPAELKPWKSLAPDPGLCLVSFAAPWEPGNYTASLVFSGAGRRRREQTAEIPLKIRPSGVNPVPAGKQAQWRFTGSASMPRKVAQLNLSVSPRSRLDCSDADRNYLLRGWHDAEALGGNRFRRWTQQQATAVLGGPGNRLRMTLEDRRPRQRAVDPTRLKLQVDDLESSTRDWFHPGRQVIEIPWPDDGLIHQLTLDVDPVWTPQQLNLGTDSRELGVLLYSLKVFYGP